MRVVSLVFSFLLTASLVVLGLALLEDQVGQQRIVVKDEWLSSDIAVGKTGMVRSDSSSIAIRQSSLSGQQ